MSEHCSARCQGEIYQVPLTAPKTVFQFKGGSNTNARITGAKPTVSSKPYQDTADKMFPTIARFQPCENFLFHTSYFLEIIH